VPLRRTVVSLSAARATRRSGRGGGRSADRIGGGAAHLSKGVGDQQQAHEQRRGGRGRGTRRGEEEDADDGGVGAVEVRARWRRRAPSRARPRPPLRQVWPPLTQS
jgi:hypothetical protein